MDNDNDTSARSPRHAPERAILQGSLDSQRAALLRKLDGLDTEQATRRLVPSATTLLGVVKHCMDVEGWWFRVVMDGQEAPPEEELDPLSTWRIEPGETVDALVAAYRAEAAGCARAVARYDLDDVSRRAGPTATLRWIYIHMIEELARHCGFVQLCALEATIHAGGLTIRTLRRQESVGWDDVSSLTSDAPRPPHPVALIIMVLFCWFLVIPYVLSRRRPRLKYSLTLTTNERIRIPSVLASKTSLVDTIDNTVASYQLPATVARFRSGIPSHFGAFLVDADGLHERKKVLPWRDVHLVTRTASGIAVFRTGVQSA